MACVFDLSHAMPELINSTIARPELLLNWRGDLLTIDNLYVISVFAIKLPLVTISKHNNLIMLTF